MSFIVTRSGTNNPKGSPLTNAELDANFDNLEADKYQSGDAIDSGALTVTATGVPAVFQRDNDGNGGSSIELYANSATPADLDRIATIFAKGNNSVPAEVTYGALQFSVADITSTTEDAELGIQLMKAGTLTEVAVFSGTETTFTGEVHGTSSFRIESDAGNLSFAAPSRTKNVIAEFTGDTAPSWGFLPTSGTTNYFYMQQLGDEVRFNTSNNTNYTSAVIRTTFDTTTGDWDFGTGNLTLSGDVGIGNTAPLAALHVSPTYTAGYTGAFSGVSSYNPSAAEMLIGTNLGAVAAAGDYTGLRFQINGAGSGIASASIIASREAAEGDGDTSLSFLTRAGTGSITERMRIDSAGNVGIGTDAPTAKLEINGGTGVATSGGTLVVRQDGDASSDGIALTSSNAISHRMWKNAAGSFFMGPSNLPSAFTQDSSGNVGIGTDDPSSLYAGAQNLVIGDGSAEAGMTIYSSTTTTGNIYFADGTAGAAAYAGYMEYNHASNYFRVGTAGAERLRIDSSGNLLVGKTAASSSTAGGQFNADGFMSATRAGETVAHFNRLTDDGTIIELRKDSVAVGSIGSLSGDVYIGTGVAGVKFADANPSINPHNTTTNATADNSIDLGTSSARFKDLYLSGSAIVGTVTATGAVNTTYDSSNSATVTTTSITQTAVHTFPHATYGSGKYQIQATSAGERHISDILIVHNGTTASATEYGTILTSGSLYTVDVDISGANARVLITSASTTSTVYKVSFTLIEA